MKRFHQFFILSVLIILSSCSVNNPAKDKDPNILLIFPDQLRRYSAGYWQEEAYSNSVIGAPDPVHTPTIDDLARNGVVFTNAISNFPLCSPYRGMMLTGQYPEQNGIWGNCRTGRSDELKDEIKTMTDLFFEAGYNTAYFGKCHWEKTEALFDEQGTYQGTTEAPGGHLVNTYDTYVPPGPARHSIEYFYQALKDTHIDPLVYSNDPLLIDGKKDGELFRPKVFSPKNESEQIIKYLRNTHKQRDIRKPFLMIWSLNPPHNPWNDENTDMFMFHEYYDTNNFSSIGELAVRENVNLEVAEYARNYFANVSSVDKYVGEVIDELERQGILENTIVIFTSDHGEMLGSHNKTGKNVMETEAIAIPFIVHYPAKLKPGIIGSLFGAVDVLPTILGLANLQAEISDDIKGKDFSQELRNPGSGTIPEDEALLMLAHQRGIYTKEYTFCVVEEGNKNVIKEIYLYDNLNDPYQINRLNREDKPEAVDKLLVSLGKKLKEANDPWYQKRKYDDLIIYPE